MTQNYSPIAIEIPNEVTHMTPKEVILLMRSLGVGKENFQPPFHARAWTTSEFLEACTRREVMRNTDKFPPERTTVDGWFSPKGPVPDDRRDAWHFFFQIFFSYERRRFGTQEWKRSYFDAVLRKKIQDARAVEREAAITLSLVAPSLMPMRSAAV